MTQKLKSALLVGLAGIGLTARAATYNGDLVIGFTAQTGNDLEYDLGSALSLTDGETWDLNSLLGSFDLSTVKWGVIGDTPTGTPKTVWATKATGTPLPLNGNAAWSPINSTTVGIYSLFASAGAGVSAAPTSTLINSWNQQTLVGTGTTYKNVYMNPNTTGITSVNFWKTVTDNTAPVVIGTFSLAANGVVTFNVSVTPPSPPPPPVLSITRSGDTSSISFLSTNSATYTLYFTNTTAMGAPINTWPSQVGTISGDGSTKTFQDTTTDPLRLYRVGAQ